MAKSQDTALFKKEWLLQGGDTLPYRILLPDNYNPAKSYPLIIFLHGRGESGTDNTKQLTHGAGLFLADSTRSRYPAIVVFPQCPVKSYWSNVQMIAEGSKDAKRQFYFPASGEPTFAMRLTLSLIDNLKMRFKINTAQTYVMGLSMGAMGTFELVKRRPELFAAAIPICGGGNPTSLAAVKNVQWWVFHGAKDDVVLPEYSEIMVKALKKAGATVRFTLYPDANHNSWDPAFAEPNLLKWLFSQRKH